MLGKVCDTIKDCQPDGADRLLTPAEVAEHFAKLAEASKPPGVKEAPKVRVVVGAIGVFWSQVGDRITFHYTTGRTERSNAKSLDDVIQLTGNSRELTGPELEAFLKAHPELLEVKNGK